MNNYKVEKQMILSGMSDNMLDALYESKAIIAGGIVSRVFSGREITNCDVDVYFRSKEDIKKALFALQGTGDIILDYTDKSIMILSDEIIVQFIIIDYVDSIEEIFSKFDFTCVMGAFDTMTDEFYFHDNFMQHNSQRKLVYNRGTMFPIISALRVNKYREQGYSISRAEFMKVILSIMELNIQSWDEMERQLGKFYGMEVAEIVSEEMRQKEFSVSAMFDALDAVDFDYQLKKELGAKHINNYTEFVLEVIGEKLQQYAFGGKAIVWNTNKWERADQYSKEFLSDDVIEDVPFDAEIAYKFVRQLEDGTLVSNYRQRFEYKVGEIAQDQGHGLYFYYKYGFETMKGAYGYGDDKVCIEVRIIRKKTEARLPDEPVIAYEADVLRIVPKEEYEEVFGVKEEPYVEELPF